MESLARTYRGQVDFYVLYVKEPHPGENYPEHKSFAEKLRYAKDLQRLENIERPILIDDLEGTMHRHYGVRPNSLFVIGKDGVVSYRADWSEPGVEEHIQALLAKDGNGAAVTPVSVKDNLSALTPHELGNEYRVLTRAGFRAVADFVVRAPALLTPRIRKLFISPPPGELPPVDATRPS